MELCLCGKCAKERFSYQVRDIELKRQSLEARKRLAMSFESYKVYACQSCGIYLYFDGFRWQKSHDLILIQSFADFDLRKQVHLKQEVLEVETAYNSLNSYIESLEV